jgi:hypothetical protein
VTRSARGQSRGRSVAREPSLSGRSLEHRPYASYHLGLETQAHELEGKAVHVMRVYGHAMRRDGDSAEQLRALVGAVQLAPNGTIAQIEGPAVPIESASHLSKMAH